MPSDKAENIGNTTNNEGTSTMKTKTNSVSMFLEPATLGPLNLLSNDGQIRFEGSLNLGPKAVMIAKIVKETAIRIRLTKTSGPSPKC